MKNVIFILGFLLAIFLFVDIEKTVNIELSIKNNSGDVGHFYFDTGNGFNEREKIIIYYEKKNIKLAINKKHINSLRYDPLVTSKDDSIFIKYIKINNKKILNSRLASKSMHSITKINRVGKYSLEILLSGEDPYLILLEDIFGEFDGFDVDYIPFFISLIGLFLILYRDEIELNQCSLCREDKKVFLLIYLLFFTIFIIFGYMYNLNYDIPNITYLSKLLFFDIFGYEFVIVLLLVMLLFNKYIVSSILSIFIVLAYVAINMTQYISFIISGEFLTKLAIDNTESINLLLTTKNVGLVLSAMVIFVILPIFIAKYFTNKAETRAILESKPLVFLVLLYLLFVGLNSKILSSEIIHDKNLIYKKNSFRQVAPVEAFFKAYFPKEEKINMSFSPSEIDKLHKMGFNFNPDAEYPLMKKSIYNDSTDFQRDGKKPNVILLFTEGLSARTSCVYSDKYYTLTKNISNFSEHSNSIIVNNYYNHTAATYRGLEGQLCSLYPKFGGANGWDSEKEGKLSQTTYKCLPHILAHNGYESIYLNFIYKDYSKIDEMVSNFGFDQIISGEELSNKYLNGVNKLRDDRLTDHQSYSVLTNYLKDTNLETKPFFIALYTSETHAWIDVGKDGKKYKDGKNNCLNTIHNMDHAFGEFWNYFKDSKYAKNTIVIFTTDHAHYYEKTYVEVMDKYKEDNYKRFFIDQIPLIIYDPTLNNQNKTLNVNSATSIDLAPSIVHYLNLNNEDNSFLGHSLFQNTKKMGVANYGHETYLINQGMVYNRLDVPDENKDLLKLVSKFIRYTKELEVNNKIYHEDSANK